MRTDIRKPAKSDKTPRRKKHAEQQSDAMDLFASPKRQKSDGEIGFLSYSNKCIRSIVCLLNDIACHKVHDIRVYLIKNYGTFM